MSQILLQLNALAEPFNIVRHPTEVLDIILVAGLFYGVYSLINQTRAVRILYGIFILAIIGIIGRSFQLTLLNSVMRWILTSIAVAIPVVFQPELRQALEKVGRSTNLVADLRHFSRKELDQFIIELVGAVKYLIKHRWGALIVISRGSGLREYIESGQVLNAHVSEKLISTLFSPKSPLHDGAIIIEGNQIAAAGVTLPLAQEKVEQGTRHRAALGISQEANVLVIVVSEENQSIEIAYEGALLPVESPAQLTKVLTQLLSRRATFRSRSRP